MAKVDMLLVPTALHHYTVKEIYQEERDNDQVGTLTVFHTRCKG